MIVLIILLAIIIVLAVWILYSPEHSRRMKAYEQLRVKVLDCKTVDELVECSDELNRILPISATAGDAIGVRAIRESIESKIKQFQNLKQ